MKLLKIAGYLLVVFGLCGCATHQVDSKTSKTLDLDTAQPVYVAWAEGSFQEENKQLQAAFQDAFSIYADKVLVGTQPFSLEMAFKLAQSFGKGYIVYPKITYWEDNNTPWNTKRDKITVEVVLVDAVNVQVLGKSTLNGKSSPFVFKNDTPAAILPELTKRYVEGLFLHL